MSSYDLGALARTLFEESGDALFLFDPDSERMLDVNAMAQRLSTASDRRKALEDVAWALLNAKEFVLRN